MDMVNSRQGFAFFLCGAAGGLSYTEGEAWQSALNYGSLLVLFYGGRTCDRRIELAQAG